MAGCAGRALERQQVGDHRQRDVGFEQCDAYFAQRRVHVALGQPSAASELGGDARERSGQGLEHGTGLEIEFLAALQPHEAALRDERADLFEDRVFGAGLEMSDMHVDIVLELAQIDGQRLGAVVA